MCNSILHDLDFDLLENDKKISNIKEFLINFGYKSEIKIEGEHENSLRFRILINGPLYKNKRETMCRIIIDFSEREKPLIKPVLNTYYSLYNDVPPFQIWSLDLKEILAEKIRALVTRKKARDLYDINFLLKKNVDTDIAIVNKKLEYYGLGFSEDLINSALRDINFKWVPELKNFTNNLEDFHTVSLYVSNEIIKMPI